jgi:competence protein ComEC
MRLVYFSLAFVLGIYLGSHYSLSIAIAMPTITAAIFAAIICRKHKHVVLCSVCIAVFLCGSIRFGALPSGNELQPYVGTGEFEIIGVVSEEPEPRDESTELTISTKELDGAEVSGTLLVRAPRYPAYQYGDLLQISGELEQPPDDLDGFNYRAYLESQGIYATMYHPYIELLASGQGPQPLQALYSLRHRMGEALKASISEPQGSLARATLLGLRYDIPDSLNQDFQRSGTAHLIAISGLNMAIVAGIVLGIAVRLFGRRRPTYFL